MGCLRNGDERLHYSDGQHRWVSPDASMDPHRWRSLIESHVAEHRDNAGGGGLPDKRKPPTPARRRRLP